LCQIATQPRKNASALVCGRPLALSTTREKMAQTYGKYVIAFSRRPTNEHTGTVALDSGDARQAGEMKARIEDIAETIQFGAYTSSAIRAALTTLAEECYERAARKCERRAEDRFAERSIHEWDTNASYYPERIEDECLTRDEEDADCAEVIRKLKEELK
jgi:hypothetical protein